MARARILERLSAADNYALLGDDFGWPWGIGVATIDESRLFGEDGWFRVETVREWIEPKLGSAPRFWQLLVSAATRAWLATPRQAPVAVSGQAPQSNHLQRDGAL
jgi:hypothetical protein